MIERRWRDIPVKIERRRNEMRVLISIAMIMWGMASLNNISELLAARQELPQINYYFSPPTTAPTTIFPDKQHRDKTAGGTTAMDASNILWGLNTFLLGVIGFFYKILREDLKDLRKEIQARTLIVTCDRIHADLAKDMHIHGTYGTAGEVIKK